MACRHIRFELVEGANSEWVPMALREATCMLRGSNPEKWNQVLRCNDVDVEDGDIHCMHNLEGTWDECPLYRERKAEAQVEREQKKDEDADDQERNEFGYPLRL